ncbi:MAG: U32 family peptidase [bacterium]
MPVNQVTGNFFVIHAKTSGILGNETNPATAVAAVIERDFKPFQRHVVSVTFPLGNSKYSLLFTDPKPHGGNTFPGAAFAGYDDFFHVPVVTDARAGRSDEYPGAVLLSPFSAALNSDDSHIIIILKYVGTDNNPVGRMEKGQSVMDGDFFFTIGTSENDTPSVVKDLIAAGADEFYCGIIPPDWAEKYGFQISLNRREFRGNHFLSYESLARMVEEVHSRDREIFVTFNASYYVDRMYKLIIGCVKRLEEMKVDGFIVSDIALILALRKLGISVPLIISGEAGVYNNEALDFFREFGIRRVILPRHLTVGEIGDIIARCAEPKPEFEVFLMNQRCPYNSNVCTPSHGWIEGNFCFSIYDKFLYKRVSQADFAEEKTRRGFDGRVPLKTMTPWLDNCANYNFFTKVNSYTGEDVCGVCAVDDLIAAGVKHFKLVSRGYSPGERTSLLRKTGSVLRECRKRRMKPAASRERLCEVAYRCYYRNP